MMIVKIYPIRISLCLCKAMVWSSFCRQVEYQFSRGREPFRYASIQVDFANDASHSHRFVSNPIFFDLYYSIFINIP